MSDTQNPAVPLDLITEADAAQARADRDFDRLLAEFSAANPLSEVEALTYHVAGGGRMIVKTPDDGTYSKFLAESSDRAKSAQAATAMCRRCILWPDLATVDSLFRRKPGLSMRIADKLLDKAGAADEVALGK